MSNFIVDPYRYVAGGIDIEYDFCNNTVVPTWTTVLPASINTGACQLETTVFDNDLSPLAYTGEFEDLGETNWTLDYDVNVNSSAGAINNYVGVVCLSNVIDVRNGETSGDGYMAMFNLSANKFAFGTMEGGVRNYGGSTLLNYTATRGTNYYLRSQRTAPDTVFNGLYANATDRNNATSALGTFTYTLGQTVDSLTRIVAFYGEDSGANGSSYQDIYYIKLVQD